MGIKGISNTLTFKVTEENLSGVTIWCGVFTKPISYILSSYNATLIVYGEYSYSSYEITHTRVYVCVGMAYRNQ